MQWKVWTKGPEGREGARGQRGQGAGQEPGAELPAEVTLP